MKKRIAKLVTVTAMVLALTFGMYSNVFADFVYDYDQVYPESGYYYLTNYKTGEFMYYDKEATWKYIKCGDEDDADIWYIHGNSSSAYEIALAKNTDYILHFDGDADEDSELKIKPSSKMGDHLWTFHAWHDKYTAVHWFIAKVNKKNRITIVKKIIKNKDLWKRIKKIEIQYSTDKNFKKNVKTKVISKNSGKITEKKLKKGKTYYVRIRFTNGKNVKTKWSKTVKLKKKK